MKRLIGPAHAHRDGPCGEDCYEDVPEVRDDPAGEMSDLALQLAATKVAAIRPGVERSEALVVIYALYGMGWRPPPLP